MGAYQNLYHAGAREQFLRKKGTVLHFRNTFGSWAPQNLHHACAREWFGSQKSLKTTVSGRFWRFKVFFAWQAQGFRHVAKYVAGTGLQKTLAVVVDLERLWNDAFRVAGTMISCSVMSVFEVSGAKSVERLQISYHRSVTWQASFRVAITGLRIIRLNFFVASAILLKHPLKIAKTNWKSTIKCLVNMSFLKEVSKKCFFFELQSFIFEGSLAQKLRFWASKFQFWKKSHKKRNLRLA